MIASGRPGSGTIDPFPVHVPGVIRTNFPATRLYAASKPGSSAATIKAALLNSAVPTISLSGKTLTGGRLDANGALVK